MSNIPFQDFPFGQQLGGTTPTTFVSDVVINEAYPGVVELPTEPNGVYTVFREVNGCSWWVINADYDSTLGEWTQNENCNPLQPAYALEQCGYDNVTNFGTFTRWVASATNVLDTPITWEQVWQQDSRGNVTSSPLSSTGTGQVAENITEIFAAGTGIDQFVRVINLTDTASSSNSYFDYLKLNNVVKWAVRKDGTLIAGAIPYSLITGAPTPPSFNNPTFTGTATFTGDAHIEGNEQLDGNLTVNGTSTLKGHVDAQQGLQVENGLTTDTLNVTSGITFPSGSVVASLTGNNGITVTNSRNAYNASGASLVATVTSVDSSITVSRTGQTVDLSVHSAPIAPGSFYVNTEYHAPGPTVNNGGVSLGPLPGTSANTYRIIYWATMGFKDQSSSVTVTGTTATGVTWDVSSANYYNGQGNAAFIMYFGTAQGGTSPAITWATTDYVFQTPYFGTISAGIQL